MSAKAKKIYQIKVTLMDIRPPIWRRLLVNSDIKLDRFHGVLQDAMGWMNCHLHQFEQDGAVYGSADGLEEAIDFDMDVMNEGKYRLSDLLGQEQDSLIYLYDFGDSWRHKIVLEKILPFDKEGSAVKCIKGKRACPPEDCGGPWGYKKLLEVLADPSHEEYEAMLEWVGEEFESEHFDLAKTNYFIERQYATDAGSVMH